jgi:hypothetical protein
MPLWRACVTSMEARTAAAAGRGLHLLARRIVSRTTALLLPCRCQGLTAAGKNGDTGALPDRVTQFIRRLEKEIR